MLDLTVFTDLDGTLLDHDTYSFAPAKEALAQLRKEGARVVIASSKTAAEVASLREALGFEHCPAIVENGAGVLAAGAEPEEASGEYQRLRGILNSIDPDLRKDFTGFADLGPEGVAEATGLSHEAAFLALSRQYSEPGLWLSTKERQADFIATLMDLGIAARQGGRFLTLSFGATKADRLRELAKGVTLALGDAPNDVEMIEAADYGVIVANPHGSPIPPLEGERSGRIVRTDAPGPAGWNTAVLRRIEDLRYEET